MKLIPKYSYEFNQILNLQFNETEQIQNFASILTDKDRFLAILPLLKENRKKIEKYLGFKLREKYEFYIVRGEKFKSFSEPITIEYSILPEEMLLYLIKEILKISIEIRFPDEVIREQYINAFIDYLTINGDWGNTDLVKFSKDLHEQSKKLYSNYKFKDIDFSKKTFKQHIEELYN